MRIVIVDTYYPRFLMSAYENSPYLIDASYDEQHKVLIDSIFGTSDFYSHYLNSLGCEAQDLIANCLPLQSKWAKEQNFPLSSLASIIPPRFYRAPILGNIFARLPGLMDVAVEQIKKAKPDVLYCQDLTFFPEKVLAELRQYAKLIVGQIASPLPPKSFLKGYDLILTSFPHFVPRLRSSGIRADYFRIGFDDRVLNLLGDVKKDIAVSFVGGISRHHGNALPMLEYLACNTPIEFFGYGANNLPYNSAIATRHHGEVWGLDMYRALARSHITLNRHINVAENYANNMRLFEATGVGALLITDKKDNLGELFDVGREVVEYSSPNEAAELIHYYIDHPDKAAKIAQAGKNRTLKDHAYKIRMEELVVILKQALEQKLVI
jgi:spore maturation protein CgeB